MATGTKVSALNPDTTPTSDDLLLVVNDPLGTPGSKKATTANVIAKAHGLSDGMIEVAGGVMGVATAGTDYTSPSSTETFTNKTYDTAGTGNSLSINGVAATANTGTGAVVRDTSPTLVTPTLGVASATTVNKIALTTPATGSTLTIADGQTLTVNGSATITNGTHSGTNTGDQTIPSVATGTELDTGTDNDKIATALALKNSHNVPSVAPSTSGNLLQSNGTDWVSNTVSFAKQSYDTVVASSGGDYTTISAAVAAGKTRIFVRNGTYNESVSFTASAANTHIIGESMEGTIINIGNDKAFTLSGSYSVVANLKMQATSGNGTYIFVPSGQYIVVDRVHFQTGTDKIINSTGAYNRYSQCLIEHTSNTASMRLLFASGTQQAVVNCRIKCNSNNTAGFMSVTCDDFTFTGNTFDISNGNSGAGTGMVVSGTATISGNTFRTNQVSNQIAISYTGATGNITGNSFYGFATTIADAGAATVIGPNVGVPTILRKDYVYMKNTSGGTINAGDIVTFKAVAAGNEVTTTTTASDNLVFGVAAASISSNAYGYIQTSGKTTLLKVNGTTDIAVGDFITTYTTAGIGAKATAGMLGTTPGDLAIAIALEAYTANDSSGVIDALIIEPRRL